MFSGGFGLSEWERFISSKGDELGEEGNSGGVTTSCSLDKTEVNRSWKRVILVGVHRTSGLRMFILF